MAIELKQSVKLSQQLLITPQLQQAIKLLQLSRAELVETVQKELLENPVLEESEDRPNDEPGSQGEERPSDLSTTSSTDQVEVGTEKSESQDKDFDWSSYVESYQSRGSEQQSFSKASPDDQPNYENMVANATSLHDHLEWQINMSHLTDDEDEAAMEIIGNLDDNGYLRMSLTELSERSRFSEDELDDALCIVQELDPPGVGARDLQECLLLQIKSYEQSEKTLLTKIISEHLGLLEKRDFPSLAKKLGINLHKARQLADVILCLEPKPGRCFVRDDSQYITPDVYIKKVGNEFVVVLNEDGLPKLQISRFYQQAIMSNGKDQNEKSDSTNSKKDEAQNYIQDKLKSALWLIKSIHQRQKTLYKVTKSIAKFQKDFLETGVKGLKPLVLRDVAEEIGVHESTVSRATNGKYVHTPQGIFELKYFFNTGLSSSSGGQDVANEAVKQMIKQFVSNEDPKSPLSDQAIANLLKQQDINIARRTVAKYREMMNILPSSRRRRLY